MKTLLGVLATLGLVSLPLQGQILLGKGDYSQDFNSLAGPPETRASWSDNKTLPGWSACREVFKENESAAFRGYRVSDGSANNGWIYSFGSGTGDTAGDRALGSIASGTPKTIAFGVAFSNDTASVLKDFAVSYTGEQWRDSGKDQQQTLEFSFSITQSAFTNLEPASVLGWRAVKALDFKSPVFSGTMQPLDGNAKSNRVEFVKVPLPDATLKSGEVLTVRWSDADDSGADHGLAVDDFKLTFSK